jgi:hypothetical protein
MCDLPRPLKRLIPEYKKIELHVLVTIAAALNLPPVMPAFIKRADEIMLATEARDLCAPGWEFWGLKEKPDEQEIHPVDQRQAKEWFLEMYCDLADEAPRAMR